MLSDDLTYMSVQWPSGAWIRRPGPSPPRSKKSRVSVVGALEGAVVDVGVAHPTSEIEASKNCGASVPMHPTLPRAPGEVSTLAEQPAWERRVTSRSALDTNDRLRARLFALEQPSPRLSGQGHFSQVAVRAGAVNRVLGVESVRIGWIIRPLERNVDDPL